MKLFCETLQSSNAKYRMTQITRLRNRQENLLRHNVDEHHPAEVSARCLLNVVSGWGCIEGDFASKWLRRKGARDNW